jgi:hypothetical protein
MDVYIPVGMAGFRLDGHTNIAMHGIRMHN